MIEMFGDLKQNLKLTWEQRVQLLLDYEARFWSGGKIVRPSPHFYVCNDTLKACFATCRTEAREGTSVGN